VSNLQGKDLGEVGRVAKDGQSGERARGEGDHQPVVETHALIPQAKSTVSDLKGAASRFEKSGFKSAVLMRRAPFDSNIKSSYSACRSIHADLKRAIHSSQWWRSQLPEKSG
jgi:hypothetical protein